MLTTSEITTVLSNRETATKTQLQTIANNTKQQLALLDIKFAAPDQFKSTCGVIAIAAISCLLGSVLFNDIVRLFYYAFSSKETIANSTKHTTRVLKRGKKVKPVYKAY